MSRKVDWEAISNDKHRSNYLGNSIMGSSLSHNKDSLWYTKEEKRSDDDSKRLQIKLQEEITMMEMLGLSVPSIIHNQSVVSTKQESTQTVFLHICV
ncbi:uncharacterized protein [Blastocystis hominis]|uniref:Multiple myeloma tumor-associated protein 2-like N-terminal domain-containing protein n=1 Tax=Blastocystis hominis TaxID=12968 RepID=D8MA73_BLAHO|nr:uncharacterized protein [Blastocystis hominis]CBK24962.2 unnamed protein product [Blastocystis hominis]|eukprot:XP_012899010.1 uncharacterized protein [Blastocystis hominis]